MLLVSVQQLSLADERRYPLLTEISAAPYSPSVGKIVQASRLSLEKGRMLAQRNGLEVKQGCQPWAQNWHYLSCLHSLDMVKPIKRSYLPTQICELCLSLHDGTR